MKNIIWVNNMKEENKKLRSLKEVKNRYLPNEKQQKEEKDIRNPGSLGEELAKKERETIKNILQES